MFYTRKGDNGTSKLFNSKPDERISKTSSIFDALGGLDELNSFLGLCKVEAKKSKLSFGDRSLVVIIHQTQENLFIIQAELAGSEINIGEEKSKEMEKIIDEIEQELPPIKTFFIPGGTELAARLDVARAFTRRTERRVLKVAEEKKRKISEETKAYLNRLSSLLYACVRFANHKAGIKEKPPQYK